MIANIGAIQFKVDNSAISKVITQLQKAKKSLPEFYDMVVTQMGDQAIDVAIPLTRVDTGRLISSYRLSPITHQGNATRIVVSNAAADRPNRSYAIYNEFGTRFMAPRLMLTTAKEVVMAEADDIIKTALIRLIRGDASGRYTFKFN